MLKFRPQSPPMRFPIFICLSFTLLFLPGCFDLVEDISVHSDGSGSFLFLANLSQSRIKLKTLMALDSVDGFKVPSVGQLTAEIEKATRLLSASDGITHVENKKNFDDFIFSMHFDFRDVTCLNKALITLFVAFSPKGTPVPQSSFKLDSQSFTCTDGYDATKEKKKIPRKDLVLMGDANMTCIYRFDQSIAEFSNTDAKLSKNGKSVLLRVPVPDLVNGNKHLTNSIKFLENK